MQRTQASDRSESVLHWNEVNNCVFHGRHVQYASRFCVSHGLVFRVINIRIYSLSNVSFKFHAFDKKLELSLLQTKYLRVTRYIAFCC